MATQLQYRNTNIGIETLVYIYCAKWILIRFGLYLNYFTRGRFRGINMKNLSFLIRLHLCFPKTASVLVQSTFSYAFLLTWTEIPCKYWITHHTSNGFGLWWCLLQSILNVTSVQVVKFLLQVKPNFIEFQGQFGKSLNACYLSIVQVFVVAAYKNCNRSCRLIQIL